MKFMLSTLILFIAVASASPVDNLEDFISWNPELSWFNLLEQTCSQVVFDATTYSSTVFAPSNTAINRYLATDGTLPLEDFINYHVIGGRVRTSIIQDDTTYSTFLDGTHVRTNVYTEPQFNELITVNGVPIVERDQFASNGVLHVISPTAIFPPTQSVLDVIRDDSRFSILKSILFGKKKRKALGTTLIGDGVTFFLPTDEAFNALYATLTALGVDLNALQGDALGQLISYHVAPRTYFTAAFKEGNTVIQTEGADLTVTNTRGKFTLTDGFGRTSTVTHADWVTTNGVIHVIDTVLIPPQFKDNLPTVPPTEVPTTGAPTTTGSPTPVVTTTPAPTMIGQTPAPTVATTGAPTTVAASDAPTGVTTGAPTGVVTSAAPTSAPTEPVILPSDVTFFFGTDLTGNQIDQIMQELATRLGVTISELNVRVVDSRTIIFETASNDDVVVNVIRSIFTNGFETAGLPNVERVEVDQHTIAPTGAPTTTAAPTTTTTAAPTTTTAAPTTTTASPTTTTATTTAAPTVATTAAPTAATTAAPTVATTAAPTATTTAATTAAPTVPVRTQSIVLTFDRDLTQAEQDAAVSALATQLGLPTSSVVATTGQTASVITFSFPETSGQQSVIDNITTTGILDAALPLVTSVTVETFAPTAATTAAPTGPPTDGTPAPTAAPTFVVPPPTPLPVNTLYELTGTPEYSVLRSDIDADSTISALLQDATQTLTLFAPSNVELAAANVSSVPNLGYSIAKSKILLTQFVNDHLVATFSGNDTIRLNTYSWPDFNDVSLVNGQDVLNMHEAATNGIFYPMVMLTPPTQTFYDAVSANPDLSTLKQFIDASAGAKDLLNAASSGTLFAPSNAAFTALEPVLAEVQLNVALLVQNAALTERLIKYHYDSSTVFSAAINGNTTLSRVEGGDISFGINNGTISVSDGEDSTTAATVTWPDVFTSQGVIHVIDNVLVPSGLLTVTQPPTTEMPTSSSSALTFSAIIVALVTLMVM